MALVHDNIGEFALVPRDRAFSSDFLSQPFAHNLNGFLHSSSEMDYNSQLASLPRTPYDPYPVTTSYATSSTYYAAQKNPLNPLKVGDENSMPRPTPSASPSSMSQTFDQPLSALSSTSGASAQSAASSVGGSPYVRPSTQMPFHDKWSDPLQGLGISSGIGSGEFSGYDPSRPDFVGEYQLGSSSSSSAGPSTSFISLPPALQKYSSNNFMRSETCGDFQAETMSIDEILHEVRRTPPNITPLMPRSASISKDGSRCMLSGTPPDIQTTEKNNMFSLQCNKSKSTTPQPLVISPVQARRRISSGDLSPLSTSPTLKREHQDPFFCQSSGRFVAPLHSSCWFSLTC